MLNNFDLNRKKGGVVDLRKKTSPRFKKLTPAKALRSRDKSSKNDAYESFFKQGQATYFKKRKAKKSSPLLIFLIILLVLLVAAAIVSFFVFDQGAVSNQSLRLTLATPKAIASGEEMILEVGYENLDKVSLEQLELVIQYPEGFFFNSSSLKPYNQEKNIWTLPPLAVGQSGKVQVKGQLVGKVEEEKELTVVFHYQPANFHSDFRETLSKKVKINDTLLAVAVEAPLQTEEGREVELKVNYKNNQKEEMSAVYLAFDLGEAFKPTGFSSTSTDYQWFKEKLARQEEGQIIVRGQINRTQANPFPWYFKVWQFKERDGELKERLLFQESGQIEILAPELEIKAELLSSEQKINWGEVVDFKVTYKNTGQMDVKEAVLKLAFNKVIDWPKYNNATQATLDDNTLVWISTSGEATQGLSNLPQGSAGELMVNVPLMAEPEDIVQLSPAELAVDVQASLSIRFNNKLKTFSSEHLILPIASPARLITEARYYLDQQTQVGEGPLPPKIGQETKYRIYWKLFTGSKGLDKVKIKTSLPAYINWLKPQNPPTLGTPLQFDNSSRQIVWEIEEVSPHSSLMASFDVTVVPVESQVNQLLILTNPTSLNAEEKETKVLVSKTANLLTSDLVGDPAAQGKGRVTVGE